VTAGLTISEAVTASVTVYVSSQFSLAWQSAGGATGGLIVSGGTFSAGGASINQAAAGLTCAGNGTANGTAAPDTIIFDIPSFTGTNCLWSTNNHFALHR